MSQRGWSLATRLTWAFTASTLVLVVAIAGLSAWYLRESVHRELDALLVEELHEMVALHAASEQGNEAIEAIAADLQEHHPANRMAWRVWDAETGEVLDQFGPRRFLTPDVPAMEPLGRSYRLDGGRRWRSEELTSDRVVGLVLDGSAQLAMLRRYGVAAAGLIAASLLLALLVGRALIRRGCGMLHAIADRTRRAGAGGEAPPPLRHLPDEMREVVDALEDLLARTRKEQEDAKLFTAGLAHEMRSPIQNLVGETEVALLSRRKPEDYEAVLRSHLEELRELGDAVNNLVSICSPRAGARAPVEEDFDLGREVELRLERERTSAEQRGVALELETAGDTRMHGDREAVVRAVRNLTENAIKWSAGGDAVRVRIEGRNGSVVVTVDDAGPGVPAELRDRIFEPFYRGPAVKGQRLGYGLGLAIVRRAVDGQGGALGVEDAPGGGARFRMSLHRSSHAASG